MGLDTVELVMDVEESFDIEIPDDDAQQIVTVGDLFEFIKSKTDLAPAGTCLTAATFYDIRRAFQESGIDERFGPSTPLGEVAPKRRRRSFWADLSLAADLKFPQLVRPSWVVCLNVLATLAASLLVSITVSGGDESGMIFVFALIGCLFVFGWISALITQPFATQFASDFNTFRGLSERVLALNAVAQKNKHGPMGANDIWVALRNLIVNQLGVDADEVTPTASFIKDLGCD